MSKQILIIDDDPGFREMVSIALLDEFPKLIIEEARDGHVGEKKLKENKYDIILLDYNLPFFMSGLRFLEKTEKLRSDTPMIMITGEGNEEVAAKAFRLGATNYLVKGNNLMMKLIGIIRNIFEKDLSASDSSQDESRFLANLNTANSGIELVKQYQKELNNTETQAALRGELMMLEFDEVGEFNKFSRFVKFMRGVKIKETRILEKKFVLLLSLMPIRFQRIAKTHT